MNFKQLSKRIGAYLIDIILISILATALTNIKGINKNYEESKVANEAYLNLVSSYTKMSALLPNYYEDKELSKEEYDSLIDNNEYFSYLLVEKYDDGILTEEEYNAINDAYKAKYNSIYQGIYYNVQSNMTFYYVVYFILVVLYFGVFPIYTKGQTLGKKLTHLRVVKNDYEDASFLNYLIRSIILYNLIFNIVDIIFIKFIPESSFYQPNYYLSLAQDAIQYLIMFSIFFRTDNRGLHDLLAKTSVVEIDKNNKIIPLKDKEVIKEKNVEAEEITNKDVVEAKVIVESKSKNKKN